jgi:ribosomal protein S18 acetylase RimI-like enzyme
MNIVACADEHGRRLTELFGRLSERDLTLIKEDLTDPDAVRGSAARPGQQWVALDGPDLVGYAAIRPLAEWSDHVGELRLVVDPTRRSAGVGRALARHALVEAVRAGRRKLVVELAADQGNALAMFTSLGFIGEALLRDHIRDRNGTLHDLVMLAHFVDGVWAGMDAIGLSDELGWPETVI